MVISKIYKIYKIFMQRKSVIISKNVKFISFLKNKYKKEKPVGIFCMSHQPDECGTRPF